MAEDNKKFAVKIITPDRTFYEGEATMVEFNTTEGEIGVYKNHIPLTVIVKPGVLTITEDDGVKKAAIHSGFVEILGDSVTFLAEVIEWPNEIDEQRAMAAKERAERLIREKDPKTDIARAETALMRAMARINVIKA
ncbi:MAG: ATP synthase F1 subunit epsilon [Lachnospiraceae bacterium]|nr:ATP synthase F1 subunit epsilon [Candidatus Colinaster equi]